MYSMFYIIAMDIKRYKQLRILVVIYIIVTVSVASTTGNYLLAVIGLVTGMVFMRIVRAKSNILVDEREVTLRQKAAHLTYAIFTPVIGLSSFFLLIFARDQYYYLEALGLVLAYLTLFIIGLYALTYLYLNQQHGGDHDHE